MVWLSKAPACALLLVIVFITSGCTHRGPWSIEEYIQALERPERDEYQKPDEVLKALNLHQGMVIADIGAGSGYFTRRFAQAIGPAGTVIDVDTEPQMLEYNQQQMGDLGETAHTQYILGKPDDPSLPRGQIDLIFFCNVYHHLDNQMVYLQKATSALSPTGRMVIIDFYHDERSGKLGFSKHHLVPQETVIQDLHQAGFNLVKTHEFLPRQYFMEFSR